MNTDIKTGKHISIDAPDHWDNAEYIVDEIERTTRYLMHARTPSYVEAIVKKASPRLQKIATDSIKTADGKYKNHDAIINEPEIILGALKTEAKQEMRRTIDKTIRQMPEVARPSRNEMIKARTLI